MNQIKEALLAYGLSANETTVYLFLIQNQDVPAYKIAQETLIPRATVYKILEGLIKKGCVSTWIKNSVHYFSAESPNTFLNNLDERKQMMEFAMPQLAELFSSMSVHPSAKLYVGNEGVKKVFEHILSTVQAKKIKRIYALSDYQLIERFPKYFQSWRKKRNKTDVFTCLLVPNGPELPADYNSDEKRETRMLPERFPIEGGIDIYGDNVAFFSFKKDETYSILIESKIIADMLAKLFVYIWDGLEKRPQ